MLFHNSVGHSAVFLCRWPCLSIELNIGSISCGILVYWYCGIFVYLFIFFWGGGGGLYPADEHCEIFFACKFVFIYETSQIFVCLMLLL